MKRTALIALAFLVCVLPASARGGPTSTVHVYVVVPSSYSSTVTPAQGVSAVQTWLGQPTDAACIGSQFTCSIEGWFRHELGQVFDYDLTTVPVGFAVSGQVDACGSADGGGWYWTVAAALSSAGYDLSNKQRVAVMFMGGGGWAGHFAPNNRVDAHLGMTGDWGVMNEYDQPNGCDPSFAYESPAHGFSHEFAGMMGEYVTAGYNEGGLFVGDVMSANERRDLLRLSGKWLHG